MLPADSSASSGSSGAKVPLPQTASPPLSHIDELPAQDRKSFTRSLREKYLSSALLSQYSHLLDLIQVYLSSR